MTKKIPFTAKLMMATGGLRLYLSKNLVEAHELKEGMLIQGEFEVVKEAEKK